MHIMPSYDELMDTNRALLAQLDEARSDLAELKMEFEREPTATLRQQLRGSRSALSKVLTEARNLQLRQKANTLSYADRAVRALDKLDQMRDQLATMTEQRDVARAELAQALAERDAEQKRRVFAEEGVENLRFLKNLWENESGFYLRKYGGLGVIVERQRRTIRALVVAARAMWRVIVGSVVLRATITGQNLLPLFWQQVRRGIAQQNTAKQSGQQAGEG